MITFINHLPALANGLLITIILMSSALIIGLMLAILFTIVFSSEQKWFKKIISSFIFFIRGTPLLVQIYLIYYGLGQLELVRESFLWPVLKQPMVCAILALSINTACYTTVLLDGAIRSIPQNEIQACYALGMSTWQTLKHIVFPRAMRLVLPAYSNEVLMILKGTSLASTITLLDLMGVIQQLISQTYAVVEWYLVAAVIYLILNAFITMIFSHFIRKNHGILT